MAATTKALKTPEEAEAWVRTADGEMMIRLRRLTHYLRQGAVLTDARLLEREDGLWAIWLRMSDRPGEFQLHKQDVPEPRLYKDLGLAIAMIRSDLGYYGHIGLTTDRRPTAAKADTGSRLAAAR